MKRFVGKILDFLKKIELLPYRKPNRKRSNNYHERRQLRRPICRNEFVPEVKRKLGCVQTLRRA